MIAPANSPVDTRFGTGKSVEPWDKKDYKVLPEEDLTPYKARFDTMRLEYMSKHYQHQRDVSRFINPKRGFFEGYVANWNAQIDHKLIISGKPRRCVRTLAAGMQSGLTSSASIWFIMGLPDQDLEKYGPVKMWLEYVRDLLLRIFVKSNVYHSTHHAYEELGQFGTSCFGMYEHYQDVLRTRSYTAGEYYVGVDSWGKPNSKARQFYMTVANIVQKYGWDNCSQKCQTAFKANQRDAFLMLRELVEENDTLIEGKIGFEGKKWRQVTWEADGQSKRPLDKGGYNEMPDIITRWDTVTSADTMGVGPGMYAIGDVKSVYRLKKDLLLGINKKVDPPVIINGAVQGRANMNPGGITRSSSTVANPGCTPAYEVDIDIKDGADFLQSFFRDLDEEFYTDLFAAMLSLPDSSKRTAAEIAAKHEEKLLLLGPVLERVYGEMFGPMIDRGGSIAMRAGLIPPPPPEIQGMQLIPRYVSILAQAQQMVKSAANERGMAFMGNVAAIYPDALDVINPDELVRDEWASLGASVKAVRAPEEVAQIRKAKQEKAAQIEQQQNMMAATVAAKNLATSPLGDSSALGHVTGIHPTQEGAA